MPLTDGVAPSGLLDIIVVEDHDLVRLGLVDFLSRPGVQVRGTDDSEVLECLLLQRHAEILVLDLNPPGEDGLSLCRRMRHAFPEIRLIMLTARAMPSDKTAGYQSGADVYLTKPPNVGELEAVIANLARRIPNSHHEMAVAAINPLASASGVLQTFCSRLHWNTQCVQVLGPHQISHLRGVHIHRQACANLDGAGMIHAGLARWIWTRKCSIVPFSMAALIQSGLRPLPVRVPSQASPRFGS